MFEYLIINATIADGSGSPLYNADVAVNGDKIEAIGNFSSMEAAKIIDAQDPFLCPGFIDIHTHSDFSLLTDNRAQTALHQGVTSEIVGQCGYSCAPNCSLENLKTMLGYDNSIEISWDSVQGYFDLLEKNRTAINVGAMTGHGSTRKMVIPGGCGTLDDDQLSHFCDILDTALSQGSKGLSVGLEYEPGIYSSTKELTKLCEVVAEHNGVFAAHVRNRDLHYDMGFSEVLGIARRTGVCLEISHISPKFGAPEDAARHAVDMIERCQDSGVEVGMDIIPDNWGPTFMVSALPPWAFEGGLSKTMVRLGNKKQRQLMKEGPSEIWQLVLQKRWDLIRLVNVPGRSELSGKTMHEVGEILGCDPHDAMFDLLLEAGDEMANIFWAGYNFAENFQRELIKRPYCGLISDAQSVANDGPLAGYRGARSVYGWVPLFFEKYVLGDNALFSMAEGVRRLTGLAAQRLRIKDRGFIRPGFKADITLVNPERIKCNASFENPCVYPDGFEYVMVNGSLAINKGQYQGSLGGQTIRH
ncbi:MAG: amidohydrolase family protein [Desulfotignum sp.]|nr:amidohydrolase family protein [Desulfotignum sp.]